MSDTAHQAGPSTECKTPVRKRRSQVAISNEFSTKRQRISTIGTIDITPDHAHRPEYVNNNSEPRADRFISVRPEVLFPLGTTPRTQRIANIFGLAEDRFLNFTDSTSPASDGQMMNALRRSASQLFYRPKTIHSTSALANLGKRRQFILALDGPGVPQDPWAYPLTWSRRNVIAVACGHDVYYQNLDTRQIAHLCTFQRPAMGRIRALEFAKADRPNLVCIATTTGLVQVWDSETRQRVRQWPNADWMGLTTISWKGSDFIVGRNDGELLLYDSRTAKAIHKVSAHKSDIYGLQWSADDRFLAVSWCPWKPELLATAGTYSDGMIKIWNTSSLTSTPPPKPIQTIPLDSGIYSLHWSPHSKELLSTHGLSWDSSKGDLPSIPQPVASSLTNSITVHSYPACKRLLSVTAHTGTVGHSCLSPDGTMVFTICYREEAMKMWKIWGLPEAREQEKDTTRRFSLR
ncbi:hypothetical protein EW146_g1943 [Bondarzewia mesenterica]|uniref:Anaphase-promoting complex subunit 4 WD40 domain-containing protein n=1 Tax=Bondarzewia mesenterica TaxID=1095465 RepID=A0A4S4M3P8_9AGAM|nr:hypothetical protein EW146_g1943 [Bondarzewia mesenterica]